MWSRSLRGSKVLQVRQFLLRLYLEVDLVYFLKKKLCSCVCRSSWVKVEVYFNLAEGQLYLLTYVNEYRGGPWAKTHTESVSHCSAGVPAWKEKRDVAKSGEYLQPCAPCVICGICESFWCSLGKCVFSSSSFRLNG